MPAKHARQAALLQLVSHHRLATQAEMVRHLRKKGFESTQASVSRDVRELGLVRVDGRYVPAGRARGELRPEVLPPRDIELITSVEPVGANLVVVRTPPGSANTVARDLDRKSLPDVAATLAGDDTIFIAVRSRVAQGRVLAALRAATAAAVHPEQLTPEAPGPAPR